MTFVIQEPRKKPTVELPEFSVMFMLPKILKFLWFLKEIFFLAANPSLSVEWCPNSRMELCHRVG